MRASIMPGHNAHNHLLSKGTRKSTMNLLSHRHHRHHDGDQTWGWTWIFQKQIKSMYKNLLIRNCIEYFQNSLRWWCVRGERPARKLKVVCCEESNCDSPPSSKQVFPQPRKYFPTDSQREHWPPQENQNYAKLNLDWDQNLQYISMYKHQHPISSYLSCLKIQNIDNKTLPYNAIIWK